MSDINLRTLVLNNNYMPISLFPLHTIPAEDAVTRVFNGTCHVVMNHEREILSPNVKMKWPSVIARSTPGMVKEGIKLDKESLYYRDHGKCQYCSTHIAVGDVTMDHYHPKSKGGAFSWENIVSACPDCNFLKGDAMPGSKTIDRFGKAHIWIPKQMPYKPTYYDLLENRKDKPITVDDESWIPFLNDWRGEIRVKNHHASD